MAVAKTEKRTRSKYNTKVMNKLKKILAVSMCVLIVISSTVPETICALDEEETTEAVLEEDLDGWVITEDGNKQYYKNGSCFKGCRRIGQNYYFFNDDGIMLEEDVTVNGATYYIENTGKVQGIKKGSQYFTPAGKKLNKGKSNELRAYQNAKRVVNALTNSEMSKEEKLKICFDWMKYNGHGVWRNLSDGGNYWCAINANDLLEKRSGDCISYACAFAYMAKVIGYKNVNVCSRGSRRKNYHTWTEINGRVYDSYFAKYRGGDKYYDVKYSAYDYKKVVLRQKVPGNNSWLS